MSADRYTWGACSVKQVNWHLQQGTYVTGYGKTAHFAHYFKIELLVFKGSVDLKQ